MAERVHPQEHVNPGDGKEEQIPPQMQHKVASFPWQPECADQKPAAGAGDRAKPCYCLTGKTGQQGWAARGSQCFLPDASIFSALYLPLIPA